MLRLLLYIALLAHPPVSSAMEDLCLRVSPLQFAEGSIKRVCRSSVPELLTKPLNFKHTIGPLRTREGKPLRNCSQYLNHVGASELAGSRMEIMLEYGAYFQTCRVLYALQRSTKPKRSFFGQNPVDLSILPPVRLPNGPTSDAQDELEAAFARGESAEDFMDALEKADPNFSRAKYLEGWNVVLHARADFDADGIEDALVSFSYADPAPGAHHFGYGMAVLRRTSAVGPAKWIDFSEFPWAAPNRTLQRTRR